MTAVRKPKPSPLVSALLTREQAAAYMGMSLATFERHVRPHVAHVRHGARERWTRELLDAWLAANVVPPTESSAAIADDDEDDGAAS
jgi:hypothetical protein